MQFPFFGWKSAAKRVPSFLPWKRVSDVYRNGVRIRKEKPWGPSSYILIERALRASTLLNTRKMR